MNKSMYADFNKWWETIYYEKPTVSWLYSNPTTQRGQAFAFTFARLWAYGVPLVCGILLGYLWGRITS